MQKYPYKEWNRLTGAPVEILRNGTTVRTGTVEAVILDSSLLWSRRTARLGVKCLQEPKAMRFGSSPSTGRKRALPHDQQSTPSRDRGN